MSSLGSIGSIQQVGPTKALTPVDQRRVKDLEQTDRRVRAHEAAHQAAAGSMGGAVSFSYETGPDGKSYAVGGEVPVDLSSGRTPQETIAKAQQVRAAALAPADPSPQDLAVAAEASQMESMARAQLAKMQRPQAPGARASSASEPNPTSPVPEQDPSSSPSNPSTSGRGTESSGAPPLSAPVATPADVSTRALATIAALQAERTAAGASQAQVQHIARLAATAYRM